MRLGYAAAAAAAIPLLCLGVLSSFRIAKADGAIGCLFSKGLCKPQLEWCFNDNAFGRCLEPLGGKEVQLDLYQYKLNKESLHLLIRELERLLQLGYHWGHVYTQCVLKNLLSSIREERKHDNGPCKELIDEDLKGALKAFDNDDDNELDPKNMAQVKFLPSFVNPHGDYADEIYIPIIGTNGELLNHDRFGKDPDKEKPNYIADLRRALIKDLDSMQKRSKILKRHRFDGNFQENQNTEGPPYGIEYIKAAVDELPEMEERYEKPKIHFTERYNTPDNFRRGFETKDYNIISGEREDMLDSLMQNEGRVTSFSKNYNTPEKFRDGIESRDNIVYPGRSYLGWDNPKYDSIPEEREYLYETFKNDDGMYNDQDGEEPMEKVYTEGGFLHVNDKNKDDDVENSMDNYNGWGFKRRERLDVKKPGPPYKTNNYAFKIDKAESGTNKGNEQFGTTTMGDESLMSNEENVKMPEKKKFDVPLENPLLRKQTTSMPEELTDIPEDPVDTSYAFIQFNDRVSTWQEGARIVRGVEELLKLDLNTFSHTRVDQNEVTFKVEPNRMKLNASEVAKRIDANRGKIKKILGVDVTSTGVGDKAKLPTVMSLSTVDEHQLWILSFLLCGVIGAIAIAGAAFFVIRRHSRTRQKLQNLTQHDSEASKDYQDLCRARMATKSPQEKTEGGVVGHRITSLARESEASNHSPSSRSSTSSWSEEPALTNMDISTGHIVLSYMEDHLKNKDRLEQEWIALCAYEAEPCATTVAVKQENAKKNRYNDILPYDHARVILNELSNISGSDYINASTITDHDPRNPAYIATQGPLQQTSADFWQMVWEQGSVVMVMLTRLTENGLAMCHRYWPEEGSDLYHIYEVHLVSEHIWCDDYLVRSFYLKNVKTGETRTVTQFHFLSWPENGVPLSTKALLEFRRKVNKSYRGRSCPIVVHCSDGVGRTGTYCLIDMVLNRMAKGAKEIDIAATLEHIRDQRSLMVRTKQQFEFVLMAVAEEVHAILKALPANHSPPPVPKEKD